MEDGLWSFPEALCELRCPAPPIIPNAVLQTKRCNETGLKVGSLCKYKCKPGYHATNKPKRYLALSRCFLSFYLPSLSRLETLHS